MDARPAKFHYIGNRAAQEEPAAHASQVHIQKCGLRCSGSNRPSSPVVEIFAASAPRLRVWGTEPGTLGRARWRRTGGVVAVMVLALAPLAAAEARRQFLEFHDALCESAVGCDRLPVKLNRPWRRQSGCATGTILRGRVKRKCWPEVQIEDGGVIRTEGQDRERLTLSETMGRFASPTNQTALRLRSVRDRRTGQSLIWRL